MNELLQVCFECAENAVEEARNNCPKDFVLSCNCVLRDDYKKKMPDVFKAYRHELEDDCYRGKNGKDHPLDYRKCAAILCCVLIKEKAFSFDENKADIWYRNSIDCCSSESNTNETESERVIRKRNNITLVDTGFINYKVAYLAALHFLYRFTTYKAQEEGWLKNLLTIQSFVPYENPADEDSYDVNMILGLARADLQNRGIDMFLLSQHFYQIEMYTRLALAAEITEGQESCSIKK